MIDAKMGLIYSKIKIRNLLTKSDYVEVDSKIDTGKTLLVLPEKVVKQLNLPVIRQQNVKYANEDVQQRDVVWGVEVTLCGRTGVFEAIVESKKNYALIGAVVMKALDLIVEPRSFGVYPNPRSSLPMAEVE
jgi:predicted aspartyl protease